MPRLFANAVHSQLRLELTSVSRRFWRTDSFATCLSARQVQPLDASQADNAHLREGTYDDRRGRSCEPNLSSQTCDCFIAKS